jgi:hypothetical protein
MLFHSKTLHHMRDMLTCLYILHMGWCMSHRCCLCYRGSSRRCMLFCMCNCNSSSFRCMIGIWFGLGMSNMGICIVGSISDLCHYFHSSSHLDSSTDRFYLMQSGNKLYNLPHMRNPACTKVRHTINTVINLDTADNLMGICIASGRLRLSG